MELAENVNYTDSMIVIQKSLRTDQICNECNVTGI